MKAQAQLITQKPNGYELEFRRGYGQAGYATFRVSWKKQPRQKRLAEALDTLKEVVEELKA